MKCVRKLRLASMLCSGSSPVLQPPCLHPLVSIHTKVQAPLSYRSSPLVDANCKAMANQIAQCRIRVERNNDGVEVVGNEPRNSQPDHADAQISASEKATLLEDSGSDKTLLETRLAWIKAITENFLGASKSDRSERVRDFDFVLKPDGSVQSLVDNSSTPSDEKTRLRSFPSRYQIPGTILEKIGSVEDKIKRTELFALGCILYELISGNKLFPELTDQEIQVRYAKGEFPDDVWGLSKAVRILACWNPDFAKELLGDRGNETIRKKFVKYVQKHPVLFGFQVLGGVATVTSLAALPVLGLVGFGALGPVAGSTAAGWQAGMGLVEAGSIFAWCQSAAMGGAALTGILATGLGGAGVAVAATAAGALDVGAGEEAVPDLKERFLVVWKKQTVVKESEKEKLEETTTEVAPGLKARLLLRFKL